MLLMFLNIGVKNFKKSIVNKPDAPLSRWQKKASFFAQFSVFSVIF